MAVQDEFQVVTFSLAAEQYGVDIGSVQEIIPLLPVIRVPEAPRWIDGLIDLRGEILPVLDLRTRFGLERLAPGEGQPCIIISHLKGQMVGLIVDSVRDVVRASQIAVAPVPPAAGARAPFLSGILRIPEGKGHRILLLLSLDRLLSEEEVEALAGMA
ncbi:MAG: chemotaxis protein CheW [Candidatus Sericytochromatia bacterium]|nr:chemotaxis protein CheW [Candidatus Sericytochromatia bacterium]